MTLRSGVTWDHGASANCRKLRRRSTIGMGSLQTQAPKREERADRLIGPLPAITIWPGSALGLDRLDGLGEGGDDLEGVAHDAVVRDLEDRRLGILVDGDDDP